MNFLRLAKKNRERNPESWVQLYENMVVRKIRAKYTLDQELAILRQRDAKPAEFEAYNAFVERCKEEVKKELDLE